MNGSGLTSSKVFWRQRFRQRLSLRQLPFLSVVSNLPIIASASTQNVIPTAAVPAILNIGLAFGSDLSNPIFVQPSSPSTPVTARLSQNALHRLEDEERIMIKRYVLPTSTDI
jgi:hypothetical protein